MENSKWKIVFMGTPEVGVPSLEVLHKDERFDVVGIFTNPDRPVGRNQEIMMSPVKEFGKENHIPVLQPEKFDEDANRRLSSLESDLVVVIAYGQILNEGTLKIPEKGFVNVHFSLLPKYRGAVPVQMAILKGETETGITIQKMVKELDSGPIIFQQKVEILRDETSGELLERLSKVSAEKIADTLDLYLKGGIGLQEQNEADATYCFQDDISKDKAEINWSWDSSEIRNFIRALNSWPIAWTTLDGKRVKIYRTKICEGCSIVPESPGKVYKQDGKMMVVCGQGVLEILEIQMEGKSKVSGEEFMRGYGEVRFL